MEESSWAERERAIREEVLVLNDRLKCIVRDNAGMLAVYGHSAGRTVLPLLRFVNSIHILSSRISMYVRIEP